MNAVDTNVLLYSLDASEPTKRPIAQALLRNLRASSEKTVLPWQVLCEATAQLRTWTAKKRISVKVATNYIQSFRGIFPIKTPRAVVFDHALELYERFSLSHWDSLLLAACIEAGVSMLYSEDLSDGVTYDSVTVMNPFVPVL